MDIEILEEKGPGYKVGIGCEVTVLDLTKAQKYVYKITNDDNDPIAGTFKVSPRSTVGKNLLGAGLNQTVEVNTPSGNRSLKIIKILGPVRRNLHEVNANDT